LLIGLIFLFPLQDLFSQAYFQQRVSYDIRVTLDDRKHELNGFESLVYFNNSSDTIGFIYFHLWPNAYSDNNTALARELLARDGKAKLFNDSELRGYIDSLDFKAESQSIKWDFPDGSPDICRLLLNKHLSPGDSVTITTPFHVKIPGAGISRLGHNGQSYQMTQFYPKPAVYDRNGWHRMPYLDQGEFYSEFGDFKVSITLPSNYVVGATGNLQNLEEMVWLEKLAADSSWMAIPYFLEEDFPLSSAKFKTITYTENNIHDFAWFADKRFRVMKGHVKLPQSGREVATWAMFAAKEGYLWKKAISYINSALWYFSEWNGDYPYDSFIAVQSSLSAGDGMEYPGLTVIGSFRDPYFLDQVIAHEICHSWFYSALGSDERRYPFMDEGITTSNESRYMSVRYPDKKLWELTLKNLKIAKLFNAEKIPADRLEEMAWLIPARVNREQELNLSSSEYAYIDYGNLIYSKASRGFAWLRSYLGDSQYDSIMHGYYRLWKNKHPAPEDLRDAFECHTNKDLSWFFDDFLGTTKRLDYKIVRAETGKILVRNKGELNGPILISESSGTSRSEKWVDGFDGRKWIDINAETDVIRIDPDHKMPELFRLNNNIKTSGIFPKWDPVQLQLFYTIEDPAKRYLILFPVLNWTKNNGFMFGVGLQNGSMIPKPFQYFLMPFFTINDKGLTGFGKVSLNTIPYNSFIRRAAFSLEAEQFGAPGSQNYRKVKVGADVYLKPVSPVNGIDQKIFGYYTTASDLAQIQELVPAEMRSYIELGYVISKKSAVNPYNLGVSFESGDSYQKAYVELNYKFSYRGKKNGLESRIFVGTMLRNSSDNPFYALAPGGRGGPEEYLYHGVYPDRFSKFPETFFSRQMTLSEGGIVSAVNDSIGYSSWLGSLSFSSTLPGKASVIPVKPFINILLNDHGTGMVTKTTLYFEAGLKAGIWNFFEIYFPLLVTENIADIAPAFKERIRFTFRLDKFRSRLTD